jgi:hypothetical protein
MVKVSVCPDYITHYYEASQGPFTSLSNMSLESAELILERIRQAGIVFASQRKPDYLEIRTELERRIRQLFIEKGGQPKTFTPHYFILGSCEWVKSWYQQGQEVTLFLDSLDPEIISFTYGDSFPAMRFQDGKPYRGQVYIVAELVSVIEHYGLPQVWNRDGKYGPERYIEAQVWDDAPVRQYLMMDQSARGR